MLDTRTATCLLKPKRETRHNLPPALFSPDRANPFSSQVPRRLRLPGPRQSCDVAANQDHWIITHMRSSKNRSRSKGNRNRNTQGGGNIVNRVFDSSGPEGKVRGTPQQIVDKYNQLTRDAQLSNDRVAAESFQQHAEHYTRMLAEAMREQEAKQAQHQASQQTNQGQQGGAQQGGAQQGAGDQQGGNQGSQGNQGNQANQGGGNRRNRSGGGGDQQQPAQQTEQPHVEAESQGTFDAVIEPAVQGDSGLVETPESAPKPKRPRTRRRKADTPKAGEEGGANEAAAKDGGNDGTDNNGSDQPPQDAAE